MKLDISIRDIEGEGYLCIRLADLTLLKRSKAFKPPTIEEVALYCKERKKGVDPIKWWNFYNAKNWMIGKTKMKNWQSAVITWEVGVSELPINQTPHGTNRGGGPISEDYGKPSPTAVTMPDSMKKRLANIGK